MIKDVKAVYTGGGIWLFYGALNNGLYYLVDDYGAVRITDAPWDDLDTTLYEDWQIEHLVKDIEDETERVMFCNEMLKQLKTESDENKGGFTDFDKYRRYFAEPL